MKPIQNCARVLCFPLIALAVCTAGEESLDQVLGRSRVKGGFCVILGATEPAFSERLSRQGPYVVHWLLTDPVAVTRAREALIAAKVYGQVSVEQSEGAALPYADNLVSLLLVLDASMAGKAEWLRVLRPDGELIVRQGNECTSLIKPRAAGMDEWTHWRHGPDRNSVSLDSLVDLPARVQWIATSKAPTERAHVVLTNGRFFAQDRDNTLIARDAFNGLPLWRTTVQKGNEFDWEYAVKVAALIVAKGERVYCLASDGKVKALDAATGRPVITYEDAGKPYDILLVDDGASKLGTLVLVSKNSVRALDADSGKLLWRHPGEGLHTTIACGYAVFSIEGDDRAGATSGTISARALLTGELLWKKTYDWARRTERGAFGYDRLFYEVRHSYNWQKLYKEQPGLQAQENYDVVIAAKTGEEIQRMRGLGTSARHGEFRTAFWHKERMIAEAHSREGLSLAVYKLDDFSKPAEVFKANYVGDRGFGHCYPPVLTDRFYINGQLNFTDLETHKQVSNQITRGACNTARPGYIPAYGMIYTFPKHCLCFPMLDGNVCLAPGYKDAPPESSALVKGPAWPATPASAGNPQGWPTFRHDAWRSSGTDEAVPAKLETLWTAEISAPDYAKALAADWDDNPWTAGVITAPTISNGLVYVAQCDAHRLVALDDKTGRPKWQFVTEGRIDGPPTLHQGMCLFGCRNGWVYNLRVADGVLIWKRRIAPYERRILNYGQLESPWAVAGSVLMVDNLAYVSAGIHPNADGGIRAVCIEPPTGRIVWQSKFEDLGYTTPWPAPYQLDKDRDPWRSTFVVEYRYCGLPVRDGGSVAVSRCLFDLGTGKADLQRTNGFYHIPETGVYMPRTAWRYGNERQLSPVAACRGSSLFGVEPAGGKLFRVDFEKGKAFDSEWVRVSPEDQKAGWTRATGKLFKLGAKWATGGDDAKQAAARALLVAGGNVFIATPKGLLAVHNADDGTKMAERKLGEIVWDGLAAANGRLYVSTAEGKVICLGPK